MPPETRQANRTARTLEQLGTSFAKMLRQALKDTDRALPALIESAQTGSATNAIQAARLGRLRTDLRNVLQRAGFDALADISLQGLEPLLTRAGVPIARTAQLNALRLMQHQELILQGDDLARELWQVTVRGIVGSRTRADILKDLQDIIDASESDIQTFYDTNTAIFARQVEALQAGDDPETRFLYAGPVDAKTREWCLERVGKVYTRAEIDAMDNGQLDNVFLTAGGYNCRHTWQEISRFSDLYDLDGRVPEIQKQLDALPDEDAA